MQERKGIDLGELKAVAVALIDSVIEQQGSQTMPIEPNADFYWEVPLEGLNEVKDKQPQLDVGRVSDDWEFIRSIASDRSAATPLALIHLAPVLRFLAQSKQR
jgi:hypothetical protein